MSAIPRPAAVLLPGTGSDEVFVRSVFARPLTALGVEVLAPPPPRAEAVVPGSLALLDRIAGGRAGPLLVGGISLGCHLATEWALRNQSRCAGVLAVLPAWNGDGHDAPAALAARSSAELVERQGIESALATATAGVPPWLVAELERAWRRHGTGLAGSLRAAAVHSAPSLDGLRTLRIPVGIAACRDDPLHPAAVARRWREALPQAVLRETTLEAFGADPEAMGRMAAGAWLRARQPR
jgi:pimeloyl-ACP methyl ester carboxylesterase